MVRKYRVVTNGIRFKAQCKGWFFWKDLTEFCKDIWGDASWKSRSFSSEHAARDAISVAEQSKVEYEDSKRWRVCEEQQEGQADNE